ncbi:hypothetical protein ACJJTC_008054 [Scirpophaga incertulas]
MAGPRKSYSIHDYPEHLNPFYEDDNHNKIRFWTIGKKVNRSNSITFSGIKDLKKSWAFRSFMKKGKKKQEEEKPSNKANGENSPIVYRRALEYSSSSTLGPRVTVASPERYVYGGSVTPLPRSRFQERLRSSSNHEVNSVSTTPRMARSEVTGSRLSVGSTNPFDEEDPVPPVRARRKKKRAPLPPAITTADTLAVPPADTSITSENSEVNDSKISSTDGDLEPDINLHVELKIVEDEEVTQKDVNDNSHITKETSTESVTTPSKEKRYDIDIERPEINNENLENVHNSDSDINTKDLFPKVDVVKYRRNSSINEDDIRLRRGNLEDFNSLSNKRSKSLNNALDMSYATYDINLNENFTKEPNDNDEPQKVTCKLYDDSSRKHSIDTISSTEKEFLEIDKATRELEREISKLNSALHEEDDVTLAGARFSVMDIKRRFDNSDPSSPNPIPKPRRSHYGEPTSPVNGNG